MLKDFNRLIFISNRSDFKFGSAMTHSIIQIVFKVTLFSEGSSIILHMFTICSLVI